MATFENTVEQIILQNYRVYKMPIGVKELTGLVSQSLGREVSFDEIQCVVDALKHSDALKDDDEGGYIPLYQGVER